VLGKSHTEESTTVLKPKWWVSHTCSGKTPVIKDELIHSWKEYS
jgi:hypothetical protein